MKQHFKATLLFVFFSVIMFSFISPKHHLPGKWTIYNADGTSSGEYVEFYKNGTYAVSVPGGQIGERGNYKLKHHVFSIRNSKDVCGKGYWGKYRLDFYGDDSIHLTLIEDTCADRKYDIVGINPGLRRMEAK